VTHARKSTRSTPARRVLPFALAALAATGSLAVTGTAHAADSTVRVTAGDDTYASSARPTYTFGNSTSLVAGTKNGDRMVGFLKFKVGALPAGTTVAKAELKLTRDPSTPLPASVKVKKATGTNWAESTLSNTNAPAVGDEIAAATPAATATAVTFDLTAAVKTAGTFTFAVTSPVTNSIARFRTAESGAAPQLTLTLKQATVTPAPAPKPVPTPTPTPTPPPAPAECTVDAKLVPTCNILWGAAAGGFSETPRDVALRDWEAKSGRTASIYHTYHRGDEQFPTAAEIAMAREVGKPRILFTNWKVDYGSKWADVAAGKQDARIDRLSAYIKANFTEKFYLTMHHEPENDVNATAGSGMTAKDFAAMFRHVVLRMRANGVDNAVFVMAYMNVEKWNNSPWWYDLYPGDDVVDWLGVDSYINAQPGGFHNADFKNLMDRTTDPKFPGWYTWATTQHPTKPLMAAEWGVYECRTACDPAEKAKLFDTVLPQLKAMPKIKAIVYFDTASDQQGLDMRIDSTPTALAAFQRVAADPIFKVKL
jgi:hypothetical protein